MVTIQSDHDSLDWILNLLNSFGELAHWRLRLFEYDLTTLAAQESNTNPRMGYLIYGRQKMTVLF